MQPKVPVPPFSSKASGPVMASARVMGFRDAGRVIRLIRLFRALVLLRVITELDVDNWADR